MKAKEDCGQKQEPAGTPGVATRQGLPYLLLGLLLFLCLLPGTPVWAGLPTNVTLRDPLDPPYQEFTRQLNVNGRIIYLRVYQWDGERHWGAYVLELVARAIPILERDIGITLIFNQIRVFEARESSDGVVGSSEGAEIRLIPDASEHTVLHELAHLWLDFNFHEHWVREGFADILAYRTTLLLGMSSTILQTRLRNYQQRCRKADWPLQVWNTALLDPGCAYGKSALFAALLYEVLGEQTVHATLSRLYADALQGRTFQEELLLLLPQSADDIARLFSGWVNPGPYYRGIPRL